jgi:hypothetical protein
MKTRTLIQTLPIIAIILASCGKGWEMDYGKPAAQFLQEDVGSKGKAFVGKKITVKGTVTKVDVSDPKSARVYLTGGIECNLGEFKGMAESCKVGETVYMDGFLVRCESGDVLLDPAMPRDSSAPFTPQ